jgi:glycosyltransferase involved in cell wall biosynthesis
MISVCVATFNGQAFIQEQLISILNQLSAFDEVVISDDCSSDNTIKIIQSIKDPRIKILSSCNKLGIVKNFERVLFNASGDYLFLCDQDDIWLPNKVEKCMLALRESLLVVCDCRVVDKELNELYPSFFKLRQSGKGLIKNLLKNSYLGCCMAFRKELLSQALPIPASAPMHDMWLGLIANCTGKVVFLYEPLVLYRRHGDNASPTAQKSTFTLFQKISYRIKLLFLIATRLLSLVFRNYFLTRQY